MKTLRERLIDFINSEQISCRNFERVCGLTNGYVSNLVSAGSEKLVMIHKAYPKLSIDWLLFEEGEMLREETTAGIGVSPTPRSNFPAPAFQNNGNACTNNQSNIPVEVLVNTQSQLTEAQRQNGDLIKIVSHLTGSHSPS